MKILSAIAAALLVVTAGILGCATRSSDAGWITLVDGTAKSLENWNRLGDANWRAEDGAIVADKGKGGHLVSKNSYKDFQIRAEFWAEDTTNSGIFIRAQDPNKIGANNAYEVNIYDQRPEPKYGTGAIVDFAAVSPMPKAGGKWNTYLITAKGSTITVELNGQKTVELNDSKFASGPFTLQFGNGPKEAPGGAIKWRKVEIRPL
jgi:3-keto-disaccharide hydrolase